MEELGKRLLLTGVISEKELNHALDRQQKHGGRLGQNLVALGYLNEDTLKKLFSMQPAAPKSIEETGLSISFIADLVLKHIDEVVLTQWPG